MIDTGKIIIAFCAQDKDALATCIEKIEEPFFEDWQVGFIFGKMKFHYERYNSILTVALLDKYLDEAISVDGEDHIDMIEILQEAKEELVDLNELNFYIDELRREHTKRVWTETLEGGVDKEGNITTGLIEVAQRDPTKAYELFQKRIGVHMETTANKGRVTTSAAHELLNGFWKKYQQIEENPEVAYGVRTGYSYIDEATLGINAGELFLFGGRHGCLTGETEIYDPETGLFTKLLDLIERRQGMVLSLDEQNQNLLSCIPSNYIYQGMKKTFTITTASGRRINATANHPFLTWEGWKALDQLKVGDKVATARVLPEPLIPVSMRENAIKVLAYIISEGGTTQNTPSFTNGDKAIQMDCEKSLKHFGAELKNDGSKCCHRINNSTELKKFLRNHGLLGKYSYEKSVPDIIFRLPNSKVALFLGVLWSGDGGVGVTKNCLSFGTASASLTQDVQKLLSRFGIISHYREKPNKGRGGYEIEICSQREIKKFIKYIAPHMVGEKRDRIFAYKFDKSENPNVDIFPPQTWELIKEEKDKQKLSWKKILEHKFNGLPITMAHRGISRARLERINKKLNSPVLQKCVDSEIYWDTIVSIKENGTEDVYDLTIPVANGQEPNFVANQFIVHNSGKSIFLLNIGVNAYKAGKNVLIISIEMPQEQYFERFLACRADLPIKDIQTAKLTKEQKRTLKDVDQAVRDNWNEGQQYFLIADIPSVTALTVRAEVNQAIAKCGFSPDLVIVDYLGIMKSIDKGQADWQEQLAAAEELRELGRTEQLAMLSAVQLNRDGKKGAGTQRISRSDGIGATCDVFIQILEPDEKEDSPIMELDDTLQVKIVKNRKGEGTEFQLYKNYANMVIRNKDLYRPRVQRELESMEDIKVEPKTITLLSDKDRQADHKLREDGDFIEP